MRAWGSPGGSDGEEYACSAGDLGLIPGLGRSPGERNGYPLQYSCLEDPHRQKSMVGSSPWCQESDMTERLALHFTWVISTFKTSAFERELNPWDETKERTSMEKETSLEQP